LPTLVISYNVFPNPICTPNCKSKHTRKRRINSKEKEMKKGKEKNKKT